MNLNQFTTMQAVGTTLLIKASFLVVLVLFELFLIVVHKQIRSMNMIVTQPDMFPYLQTFSIILEVTVVILILLTLVLL